VNILQLLFWFIAYSTGIAGLSLAAAARLKNRTRESKMRIVFLLSFSALVIPAMLNNLFEASGFLWTMRQSRFNFLTTGLTVLGFWGAVFLARSFFLDGVPEKYQAAIHRSSLGVAILLSLSIFLYMVFPLSVFGLLSSWLTGIVLLFFPIAALYTIVRSLVTKQARISIWAGSITIGFALFYSEILPVESFYIFPAFYICFNLVFLPSLLNNLAAQPSRDPDQEKLNAMGISPREAEVACLLLLGLSYKEIGEKLFISLPTVQTHVSRIYQKAGVNSKMELLRLFSV